ncbi:hypothetical protein E2562_017602 [Oryza meyeriana var. granulata]|uniref:Uncharacterized protein n=1 Tax=Oryza meyeriana var. granulata TaxID=110450 RepID=A0A6G1BLK4_9ORYZ|nr:hypothetical protein E2562_017602 [Oryza meyeriana var. granulata]
MSHEEAVTEREKATTRHEGVPRAAEARVRQSFKDMNKREDSRARAVLHSRGLSSSPRAHGASCPRSSKSKATFS